MIISRTKILNRAMSSERWVEVSEWCIECPSTRAKRSSRGTKRFWVFILFFFWGSYLSGSLLQFSNCFIATNSMLWLSRVATEMSYYIAELLNKCWTASIPHLVTAPLLDPSSMGQYLLVVWTANILAMIAQVTHKCLLCLLIRTNTTLCTAIVWSSVWWQIVLW